MEQGVIKAIILSGGKGTRLYPCTSVLSKQMLPIFDKPMIYYPVATLMDSGVRDILLITSPEAVQMYKMLLGDGSQWGINITYAVQKIPDGIAGSFLIGEDFINNDPVCLMLGDNLLYGDQVNGVLSRAFDELVGATIFAYPVDNPQEYGVVEFSTDGEVLSLQEKPSKPRSKYAVPGLYVYDSQVVEIAKTLKPSNRGEYEITDLNLAYMEMGLLRAVQFGENTTWFDTGTHLSMLDASVFVKNVQLDSNRKICCPDEIAFRKGYIDQNQFKYLVQRMPDVEYSQYLAGL